MILQIQRHLFKRLLGSFLMLVFLLLLTYVLLDFCTKGLDFADTSLNSIIFLARYYGCEFSKRAQLLLPICFALAMLLQFIRLSKTKELVALLCAGISFRKVLAPFWAVAIIISGILFINREYIVPPTRIFLEDYRNDHARAAKKAKNTENQIYALVLKDDSKLIYQSFDPLKNQYFDLFWIISPNRILRIKYLDKLENGYRARFIDELNRNSLGTLQKKHSFKELNFSKEWLKGSHFDKSLPIQTYTLAHLMGHIKDKEFLFSKDEVLTELFIVLTMSLSPLWLILIQAPIITTYSRQIPAMFYIGTNLLLFFCISTLLDGFGIMSQKSILSPWLLIFTPVTFGFIWIYYRYRTRIA